MFSFKVEIADTIFHVSCFFESTKEFCKKFLTEKEEDFAITIEKADLELEKEKSQKDQEREGGVIVSYPDFYLETLALYRKMVPYFLERDTILFHGSGIMVENQGYLFTAISGVGKSTHTRLWREYFGKKAVMINDDKPLLKIGTDKVVMYGTPWMGKHGLGNKASCELKGICRLERGERNYIESVSFHEFYGFWLQQIQRPKKAQEMKHLLELLDRLQKQVSFYRLECQINEEAVRVSYEGMKGE